MNRVTATRSIEGSLAVFVASAISVCLAAAISPQMAFSPSSWARVALMAAACTVSEALSRHGRDNTAMQIVPSALARVWMRWEANLSRLASCLNKRLRSVRLQKDGTTYFTSRQVPEKGRLAGHHLYGMKRAEPTHPRGWDEKRTGLSWRGRDAYLWAGGWSSPRMPMAQVRVTLATR